MYCHCIISVTIIVLISVLYWHYFILLSFNGYGPAFSGQNFPTILFFFGPPFSGPPVFSQPLVWLEAVMKISWFASQNATHFRVHANQFHMPAHVGANHLFAVYHVHVLAFKNATNLLSGMNLDRVSIWKRYVYLRWRVDVPFTYNDNLMAWALWTTYR